MNLRLTQDEALAVRAHLVHRAERLRARPDAGFVATNLAERYEELCTAVDTAPVRRDGTYSLRLDRRQAERLEAALAHDGGLVFRPILARIAEARLPKADPRRTKGRRSRQQVAS